MAIKRLSPYLNFNGTAAKAIKLYESVLGAKSDNVMRFGDVPEIKATPENKDRIMHAELHVGAGVFMVSDTMPNSSATPGSTVHVALEFEDVSDMTKKFDALAAGGRVSMPLNDTFWGAKFGMLTDAYGISWMFNCMTKKS